MLSTQEIRGQWNEVRGKVKQKWGQLTDDDLDIAEGNLEQVIGRIQQKTGEQRRAIEQFLNEAVPEGGRVERAKETASQYAREASQRARETYDVARQEMGDRYRQVGQYMERHPAESLAVVFGCGLITGVIVGLVCRSEH